MRKKLSVVLLTVVLALTLCAPQAFASKITSVKTQGNEITAEISVDDSGSVSKDKITATLDGAPLEMKSLDVKSGSTEYIVMIDTSLSLSAEHFESQKKAVTDLYKSLGKNDSMVLYTFDKSTSKILDGSEKSEDALKKISAIKAAGQDTAFYEAMITLADASSASKADSVVPIVFTDGVETLDKGAESKAEKALKELGIPVYGMYPSVEKKADSDALNELLKLSGGKAVSFTPDNVSDKLSDYTESGSADKATVVFSAPGEIAENENAALSIDLGDGKPVTKKIAVKAWSPENTETEAQTEETETQSETETETTAVSPSEPGGITDLLKLIIPAAALIILLIVVLLVFKKKKGASKKDKTEEEEKPAVEEPKEEIAAPEEPEPTVAPEPVPAEETEQEISEPEEPEAEEPAEAQSEEEPQPEGENAEAEEELSEEEKQKLEDAKRRAEERAKRRAENLEKAKAAAAARAAMMAQMGSESKEAAEARAEKEAEEAEKAKQAEKEAAKAAKERAKKEKENKKKMKAEGSNFQFYFVDKK